MENLTLLAHSYVGPSIVLYFKDKFIINAALKGLALKGLALKQASALESLSYIIILIFSWYFLGEKITKRKIIGNIIIVIGVIIYCIQ
ncbi:EamA family transporter [Bacillus mycoides]|nr:EamA family transporter [Bacillus mycoides]